LAHISLPLVPAGIFIRACCSLTCFSVEVRASAEIFANRTVGLDPANVKANASLAAELFSGCRNPTGSQVTAHVYCGHQFGNFGTCRAVCASIASRCVFAWFLLAVQVNHRC
jgi:hypothetical protein